MFRTVLLATVFLSVLMAGCGANAPIIGGSPRKVVYQSLISLSPGGTELLSAMQKWSLLKGRTASCNYPSYVTKTPVVTNGTKPDFEKIAEAKPDFIVYDANLTSDSDVEALKKICPTLFPLKATTLKDYEIEAITMASDLGGESYMSEYLDKVHQAEELAKGKDSPTVTLIIPGKGSEHMIAGTESFQADELRASGGTAVGPKGTEFVTLNPETLIQLNPDYIVTAGSPDPFLKDSRFAGLKAVKANHVFGVDQDIALRRGARVDLFITGVSNAIHGGKIG